MSIEKRTYINLTTKELIDMIKEHFNIDDNIDAIFIDSKYYYSKGMANTFSYPNDKILSMIFEEKS